MKILVLSWEYPPLSCGGLARHVEDLSQALSKRGHTIHVISSGNHELPEDTKENGVYIHRSSEVKINGNNFLDEIIHLNFQLVEKAIQVINKYGNFDLIHGHDWLVFWASRLLKHAYKFPLVYTIHATEYGRNNGIHNNIQRYINDVEWYACYEAWKIIVCSNYMKEEVKRLFQLPDDKINVINNGVKVENFETELQAGFRENYASPDEKIIFYVGRLVREKGVQYLLEAFSIALHERNNLKLVIAGKGSYENQLRQKSYELNIDDRVYFTGFISDEKRNMLYKAADLAVFPSLYEPFGIVALEAMVSKIPLITTNAGGLDEFVIDGENAFKVGTADSFQLAGAILRSFHDTERTSQMVKRAFEKVILEHNWDTIAEKTNFLYKKVLEEYDNSNWQNNFNWQKRNKKESIK